MRLLFPFMRHESRTHHKLVLSSFLFSLFLSETGPNRLTVGKIYGGMLILENWKQTKFSALTGFRKLMPVNNKQPLMSYSSRNSMHFQNGDALAEMMTDPNMMSMMNGGLEAGDLIKSPPNNNKSGKSRKKSSAGNVPPAIVSKSNDLVQNYLNTLEDPFIIEEEVDRRPPR